MVGPVLILANTLYQTCESEADWVGEMLSFDGDMAAHEETMHQGLVGVWEEHGGTKVPHVSHHHGNQTKLAHEVIPSRAACHQVVVS